MHKHSKYAMHFVTQSPRFCQALDIVTLVILFERKSSTMHGACAFAKDEMIYMLSLDVGSGGGIGNPLKPKW